MATRPNIGKKIANELIERKDARVAALSCAVFFSLAPPRSFIAVTGDIVSIIVLGAVLTIPIFTLLATDKDTRKLMRMDGENVSGGLRRFITIIAMMSASIMMLILSKMLITWFGYHHIFAIVDRILAGITGFSLGLFLASLTSGLSALRVLTERQDDPSIDDKPIVT